MKKVLLSLGVLCLMFGIYGIADAATTGTYSVKVTIVEDSGVSISVISNEVVFGQLAVGVSTATASRTVTRNTGGVAITLSLRISAKPAGWTVGTTGLTDVGADKFALASVFDTWNAPPLAADYGDEDVVTESDQAAQDSTGGRFVDDAPAADDGYGVASGTEVSNFYYLNPPTSLSTPGQYGSEVAITVTVTAAGS